MNQTPFFFLAYACELWDWKVATELEFGLLMKGPWKSKNNECLWLLWSVSRGGHLYQAASDHSALFFSYGATDKISDFINQCIFRV